MRRVIAALLLSVANVVVPARADGLPAARIEQIESESRQRYFCENLDTETSARDDCMATRKKLADCVAYNERLGNVYDCTKGLPTMADFLELQTHYRESRKRSEAQQREERRRAALPPPRVGLTAKQVIEGTNWGRPQVVNKTERAGSIREQWVYGGGFYLYLENGRVTAIQSRE